MPKRNSLGRGLGRGVDALISKEYKEKVDNSSKKEDNQEELPTDSIQNVEKKVDNSSDTLKNAKILKIIDIEPNRDQPRKNFDDDSLDELAESIRQYGILQPLLVKKVDQHYVIIAGERRWRAAKLAGCTEVPAIVKEYSDKEVMELSLIENIQREDLNAVEEAQAYQRLMEEFGYRQEDLAKRLSKSRTAVTNRLRLLKLCEKVQSMLEEKLISEGHARALIPLENEEIQFQTAMRVMDQHLSVRETEKLVKKLLEPQKEEKKEDDWREKDQFVYDKLTEDLQAAMGTKVAIQRKDKDKGKIVIDYYSTDDLERLMEMFKKL